MKVLSITIVFALCMYSSVAHGELIDTLFAVDIDTDQLIRIDTVTGTELQLGQLASKKYGG